MNSAAKITIAFVAGAALALGLAQIQAHRPAPPAADEGRLTTDRENLTVITEAVLSGEDSMLALGTMYENGRDVPRNYTKAFEWYKKAAGEGQAVGHYNVGVCYEVGLGTTANAALALESYKKAAALGLREAFYKLASVYQAGVLAKPDNGEAVAYLQKAQGAGHPQAANELGVIYLEGLLGQAKDPAKAEAMFRRSADLGNSEAMKNLAVVYKDGLAGKKDAASSLAWYLIARDRGYKSADIDQLIDSLKAALTPAEIKAAEGQAAAFQPLGPEEARP